MPSQKDMETSALPKAPESVKPATPATPTAPVQPAAPATTSSVAPSADKFRDDCIVLILSPKGTVHPMVNKPGGAPGARIFENSDAAVSEVLSNKIASTNPFAIIPLKGLF